MRKAPSLALVLSLVATATAAAESSKFGTPVSSAVSVSFVDGSAAFQPTREARELLADSKHAAMIYINGRTSTPQPSAADEVLAMRRALSARSYLVARGVSPLKIMVNFASAADFMADNTTPEGRRENQRVDIELVYVPTY